MTKQEHIDYWLATAGHDYESAQHFYQTGRYDWCLFAVHLMLEKLLKAFWVRDSEEPLPYIHKLGKLAKGTGLNLSKEQSGLLQTIETFNILTRYPDFKLAFYKRCTEEFTSTWYHKGTELYQWLLSQIESKPSSQN